MHRAVMCGCLCTPSGGHCRLFRWFLGKCFLVEVHPYMTGFALFGKCFLYMMCVV